MNNNAPIRFGVAGLGGYAAYVTDRILDELDSLNPYAQLMGVCDPGMERFPRRMQELRQKGVTVVRDFADLLSMPIEAVWLPLPIDLHCPYTQMALEAGKAVLCEKPAAGCVDDVDAMIAARDRSGLPVAIGFQDLYQPAVAALKRRFLAGEFGKVLSATVIGCWPRTARYFSRNDWAGRFRRDGRWVMDSPASNALAHFLHLPLFLLGPTVTTAVSPIAVAAELYRANPIENYDTCSVRLTLPGDIPLYAAFTHACATAIEPCVTIDTERAQIRYMSGQHAEVHVGGTVERLPLSTHPHRHMLGMFQTWVREGPASAFAATLETARVHVVAMNAASEAAPVVSIPEQFVSRITGYDDAVLYAIDDIVPMMQACVEKKQLLHESGRAPWSYPSQLSLINGYRHFAGPCEREVTPAPRATVTVSPAVLTKGQEAVEA